jgi:HlyD family secretion protein
LEKAELVYNVAAAQLASAQAALRARSFDLDAARALLIDPADLSAAKRKRASIPLLAPVSGRILRVLHESEAAVAAGAPIVEIGDPGLLEIVVEMISEDAVKVRPGMPAIITDWGGGEALTARVRQVEPSGFRKVSALGVEEQRVNVLLDFTGPAEKWAPIADGFRVVAHVEIWRRDNVLRLPMAAMFRNGKGWAVFALRDGRAKLTPVRIGRSNDDYAELQGGLAAGERVILHPGDRISDGVKVQSAPNAAQ